MWKDLVPDNEGIQFGKYNIVLLILCWLLLNNDHMQLTSFVQECLVPLAALADPPEALGNVRWLTGSNALPYLSLP